MFLHEIIDFIPVFRYSVNNLFKRGMKMDQTSDRNVLQSVDTALRLIDLFETTARLSLSDISEKLGVGKSTAFRLCHTLEQRGYLVRHSDMRWPEQYLSS